MGKRVINCEIFNEAAGKLSSLSMKRVFNPLRVSSHSPEWIRVWIVAVMKHYDYYHSLIAEALETLCSCFQISSVYRTVCMYYSSTLPFVEQSGTVFMWGKIFLRKTFSLINMTNHA